MAEEALIIFVDVVRDESLLAHDLIVDTFLEPLHDLFEDRLIEDELLTAHHSFDIIARQQFPGLEDDTVAACVEHIDPQLLIQDLTREDKHLHLRIALLRMAADLHTDSRRAAEAEVEQHEVGLLLPHQFPVGGLIGCRTEDMCLRNVVGNDSFRAFELEGHILYNDDIEVFHIAFYLFLLLIKIFGISIFTIVLPSSSLLASMPHARRFVASPISLTICRQSSRLRSML